MYFLTLAAGLLCPIIATAQDIQPAYGRSEGITTNFTSPTGNATVNVSKPIDIRWEYPSDPAALEYNYDSVRLSFHYEHERGHPMGWHVYEFDSLDASSFTWTNGSQQINETMYMVLDENWPSVEYMPGGKRWYFMIVFDDSSEERRSLEVISELFAVDGIDGFEPFQEEKPLPNESNEDNKEEDDSAAAVIGTTGAMVFGLAALVTWMEILL